MKNGDNSSAKGAASAVLGVLKEQRRGVTAIT
jgi:hypothetical protein